MSFLLSQSKIPDPTFVLRLGYKNNTTAAKRENDYITVGAPLQKVAPA
jgi:hypothetical protein